MITQHDKEYRLNASCTRIKTNECEWGIAFLTMAMEGDWQAYDSELLSYDYGYNGIESLEARQLNPASYRLLDPGIGRWYQIDPAAESFYGLSPYVSMGNNPVVMVDPDGDFPILTVILISAAIVGTGNLIASAVAGEINSFTDGLEAFAVGAIAGGAIGTGVYFGLGVPYLGTLIKGVGIVKAGTTGLSVVRGVGQGIFTGDWTALENSGEIFLGNFYSDEERSFFAQVLQLTSRHSWEILQTEVGHSYSQLRNTFGDIDRVDLYRGVTFTQKFNANINGEWGVSIGNFVNTKRSQSDLGWDLRKDKLLQHEYGHTFDSHRFGPLYLFAVGIPSVFGAKWTETRANRFWMEYILRNPW